MNTSTTTAIWDTLYRIKIPTLGSKSPGEIALHGVPHSGIRSIDQLQSKEWFFRYASVNDMVEFYKEGVPIIIPKDGDVIRIYQAISKHIDAWATVLNRGFINVRPPTEDLIILDQFAASIYSEVGGARLTERPINRLLDLLHGGSRPDRIPELSLSSLWFTPPDTTPTDPSPARASLGDFFKHMAVSLGS